VYTVLAYVLLFWFISANLKTQSQIHRLVAAITLTAVLVSTYAIFQHFGNDFFDLREPINTNRASSTLGNAIFAGSLILIAVPVCLSWAAGHIVGLMPRSEFWWKLGLSSSALAVLFLGLIFTLSRGPWVGAAVALALVLGASILLLDRRSFTKLALVLGVAAVLAAAVLLVPEGNQSNTGDNTSTPQAAAQRLTAAAFGTGGAAGLDGRIQLWESSQELVFSHPWYEFDSLVFSPVRPLFGYGPELFRSAYLLESRPTTRAFLPNEAVHAHNFFIHQTVEQGLLGLVTSAGIFLVPLLAGGVHLLSRRSGYSTAGRLLLIGLMAAIAGRMLEQMVGIARVSDITMFWVLLALFAALLRSHEASEEPPANRKPKNLTTGFSSSTANRGLTKRRPISALGWSKYLGLLAAVVVVATGVASLTWYKSIDYVRAAVIADEGASKFRDGDLTGSLASLNHAIALAPDVSPYRSTRASVFHEIVANGGQREIPGCSQPSGSTASNVCIAEQVHTWNQEWVEERPFHVRARLAAAGSALELGLLTEDDRLINESIRRSQEAAVMLPNGWPIWNNLAETYIRIGQPEAALPVLERSFAITSGTDRSYSAYLVQAEAHRVMGQTGEALASLQNAIDVHHRPQEAYAAMGLIHSERGLLQRAVDDYSQAILLTPHIAEYYFDRGSTYYGMARFQEAIQDFNEAIKLDPGLTVAYNNRGLVRVQQDQFQLAIHDFNLVISQNPQFALGFNNRGFAYRELGEYESSIRDFDQAVLLDPQLGIAYYNRAVAHSGLNQDSEAELDAQRAVELGIDPTVVRRGIDSVKTR
jgi:tetratricopeptide (TPR) repeat protein/O-antigen ligase